MTNSESLTKLAPSLVAFQAEVQNPKNTAVNPFLKNKYAPLHDILVEVRPLLAFHGLSVAQLVTGEGRVGVTTMLLHESGEYISDTVTLETSQEKGKSDAQVAGSIVTYLRRYALSAILGISSEDDPDGNPQRGKAKQEESPGEAQEAHERFRGLQDQIHVLFDKYKPHMDEGQISKTRTRLNARPPSTLVALNEANEKLVAYHAALEQFCRNVEDTEN